jgi:hypothetical protein
MDQKQQAKQIIDKFLSTGISLEQSLECSKIHVQGIIAANPHCNPFNNDVVVSTFKFWGTVLDEIMSHGKRG